MNTIYALAASMLLLALNGFFVAAEFSIVASKAHRLEDEAQSGTRSSRAAAMMSKRLSLTLAGAQLGITLCSLGLGALAEPAIAEILSPLIHDLGASNKVSHLIAFVISLALVVFLHMVAGEMAPKSWAITHPERSARLLALPFALFNSLAKPLLQVLNNITNAVLGLFRIRAADELASAHGPEELRLLLEQSKAHGTLPEGEHTLLSRMLRLQRTTVRNVMVKRADVVTVLHTAKDEEIETVARQSGRSRIAVVDSTGTIIGLVHVREAVRSSTLHQGKTARDLMSQPFSVEIDQTVAGAVETMQAHRSQLAVVHAEEKQTGVVGLEDLLEQILGQFDDETD